ncbi:homocysteine S-methyltransferase family protein [Breoghania sp. L-A4]|uniref:homocysteine S-methyltransferase family protein n=1 Tax=Breoghania sp. L-A4 TaxID=2304600 RepID=UPI000E35DAE3|nr:homocysteine S-methyltransferase family protein [Breoghania sp. L-A4]AXS42258.1 homocysteine S-methyltransferase [Breoghania sp. L-A4]
MSKYRHSLPQLGDALFLTDGGLETTLVFHEGFDLPHFAAFDLLRRLDGIEALEAYYRRYSQIARDGNVGFILETATWRASSDWGSKLGYSADELARTNRRAVTHLADLRREFEGYGQPVVLSGCVGPRGDGYVAGKAMTAAQAEAYHTPQIAAFAETDVDMISAITMTNAAEAIGITCAAQAVGMPVAISFTLETDGRLPTGQTLKDAIALVDMATGKGPAYYMINCAHPSHFERVLAAGEPWLSRLRGVRANASRCSHEELDAAETLDDGNPDELARDYVELRRRNPYFTVLGGCCGTDHRHVEQICRACATARIAA